MNSIGKWSKLRWVIVLTGVIMLSIAVTRLIEQVVTPVQASSDLSELFGEDYQATYNFPLANTAQPVISPTPTPGSSSIPSSSPLAEVEFVLDTPEPPSIPSRVVIDAIELDAPVEEVGSRQVKIRDTVYEQWLVPNKFAAGWNPGSAYPGATGNTVLFGHNNVHGKVFSNLYRLELGDKIVLYAGTESYTYIVTDSMKLLEKGVSIAQMVENAAWISETDDERLTLVTCWPPYQDTYRLIVVARPETPFYSPNEP